MKFKKNAVLAAAVAGLGIAFALPATRDEVAWVWAVLQDDPGGYELYYTERPNGIHAPEARLRYRELAWDKTKRAMIADAIKKHSGAEADPEAKKERKARMETLWWRQVTNANTVFGYNDYVRRYPNGRYVEQALKRIAILNGQGSEATGEASTH